MKFTLHKVLEGPHQTPDYISETTGEELYCVIYLAESEGEYEEIEMYYETFNEAYAEHNRVQTTMEGVVLTSTETYDA